MILCIRKLCYVRMYLFLHGTQIIFEIGMTVFFLIPSARQKLIDDINPNEETRDFIESHSVAAGIMLIAMAAVQLLSVVMTCCQKSVLTEGWTRYAIYCRVLSAQVDQWLQRCGVKRR